MVPAAPPLTPVQRTVQQNIRRATTLRAAVPVRQPDPFGSAFITALGVNRPENPVNRQDVAVRLFDRVEAFLPDSRTYEQRITSMDRFTTLFEGLLGNQRNFPPAAVTIFHGAMASIDAIQGRAEEAIGEDYPEVRRTVTARAVDAWVSAVAASQLLATSDEIVAIVDRATEAPRNTALAQLMEEALNASTIFAQLETGDRQLLAHGLLMRYEARGRLDQTTKTDIENDIQACESVWSGTSVVGTMRVIMALLPETAHDALFEQVEANSTTGHATQLGHIVSTRIRTGKLPLTDVADVMAEMLTAMLDPRENPDALLAIVTEGAGGTQQLSFSQVAAENLKEIKADVAEWLAEQSWKGETDNIARPETTAEVMRQLLQRAQEGIDASVLAAKQVDALAALSARIRAISGDQTQFNALDDKNRQKLADAEMRLNAALAQFDPAATVVDGVEPLDANELRGIINDVKLLLAMIARRLDTARRVGPATATAGSDTSGENGSGGHAQSDEEQQGGSPGDTVVTPEVTL
ncbi:MAG: hypothetical protein HYV02_08645 [Deltaproteobacteria bacterium]|nr:hypothetical protein [Deltaproteobacteria bacterium]